MKASIREMSIPLFRFLLHRPIRVTKQVKATVATTPPIMGPVTEWCFAGESPCVNAGWGIMILLAGGRLSIIFIIMNYTSVKSPTSVCETDLRARGAKRPPTAGLSGIFTGFVFA